MKEKILRLFLVSMIIMSLTMVDFAMVGQSIALTMKPEKETNVQNVAFDAYLKQNEEQVYEKDAQMNEEEILILDLNVIEKGVLNDAKIVIENANFVIQKDKVENNIVKEIRTESNEVYLNSIVYENQVKIELPIKFKKQEKIEADYFQREISINLEGTYKDETEKKVQAQRNIKINWTQDTDIVLSQNITKYMSLKEMGTLLQQEVVTEVVENALPREIETLLIQPPVIEKQQPTEIYVLANGVRLPDEKVEFNKETNVLEIKNTEFSTWGNAKYVYQIVYIYDPAVTVQERTIQLNTLTNTKLYTKDMIQKQEKKDVTINQIGNIVSINKSATPELYKGYWYAGTEQGTSFTENNILQITNKQATDSIQLAGAGEEFKKEEGIFPIQEAVTYQNTTILKEEFDRIFGQEGQITVTDASGEVLGQIDQTLLPNEEGKLIINYKEGTTAIKIKTSKPIAEGEITISNTKTVPGKLSYTKEELKTFTHLNTKTSVMTQLGEEIGETQIALQDTKTEAKLEVNNTNLSTLQTNENVQFLITLKSDGPQFDLFKNPVVKLILPTELKMEVKNITQLNGEQELTITNPTLSENEQREKIVTIPLQGEQINFVNNINGGIQISVIADIYLDKTTPSKSSEIKMNYTNENRQGEEFQTIVPVKFNSKYGVLMVNKIGNVMESIDDKEKEVILEKNVKLQEMSQEIAIINNYENPITEVSVIGKMPEVQKDKTTFKLQIKEALKVEGKQGTIYYSENPNEEKESQNWVTEPADFTKIRAFKIELGEINLQPQEVMKISYTIVVPENLKENEKSSMEVTLDYNYLENKVNTSSKVVFRTEIKEEGDENVEETEDVKISLKGRTAGKGLVEGQEVYEGQGIKYLVAVTNNSEKEITNLVVSATQENAIFYDEKVYHNGWDSTTGDENVDYTMIEEKPELKEKKITIEKIAPGETIEVDYQFSVKEIETEKGITKGKVKITADGLETKELDTLQNPIKTAKLKLQMRNKLEEEYDMLTNREYPFFVDVTNLTEETQKDIMIYIPVPEGFHFKTESLFEADNYEFIEYTNKEIVLKIPTIEARKMLSIRLGFDIKSMDYNIEKKDYSFTYKATLGKETYYSNEMDRTIYNAEANIEAKQYGSIKDEWLEDGDALTYTLEIENKGKKSKDIDIIDYVPMGAEIQKVKMKKYNMLNETPSLIEEKELEFSSQVFYNDELQPNEKIVITIDTVINADAIFTKEITNSVQIHGVLQEIKCNDVTYKVKGKEDIQDPETTYSIRGVAWVDENKNGLREENEQKLSGIHVFLMEEETGEIVIDDNGYTMETETDEEGNYQFSNLKQNSYFVVFQYDAAKYRVTEYQKTGISQDTNSDVISKVISLQGNEQQVAMTGTLELTKGDLNHIDAGFIEGETFDFALNKYINKIIIQNKQTTTVKQYDKTQLAKIELDSKQINQTSLVIEYKIDITNEGELPGYIHEIMDYQPKDLHFSSEMNKNWYQTPTGELVSQELSNQLIQPGETKSVTLTLVKDMNQDNTGTIINTSEIGKSTNDYFIQDIDSIAGNKVSGEDDMSTAEIIVSIRTGGIMLYLSFIIIIGSIIGGGSYLIKKKILSPEEEGGSDEE